MRAKKSLGQNFLNSDEALSNIVKHGEVSEKDIVLEIGPGTGNLTSKLLERNPKHLLVIEKDKDLADLLNNKFGKKIEIINDDILNCYKDFHFNVPIKVFGNLPYNISTKILTSFVKINNLKKKYEKFVLIFQKEVADRIIAEENSKYYGRLSIIASWKMKKFKITDIDPKFFSPKPKVWSTLLVLTPKDKFEDLKNPKSLEHITNIFFNQRRKMIKKPMRQLFENFDEIAKKLCLDLNLRPQNISINKYLEICKLYENLTQ